MALGGVGDAEYMRGRMISAHEGFRRCIELARQQGLGRVEVANWPMAAITRWYTSESAGALDDALAAIAAAAKVGHQRAQMIGHHAAYFCRREMLEIEAAADHVEEASTLAQRLARGGSRPKRWPSVESSSGSPAIERKRRVLSARHWPSPARPAWPSSGP
jgi:hypothetical protein